MLAAPRRPDAHLFDREVLLRGLWQGGGLLLALVGVNSIARALAVSDDAARATTFCVLVLSNLGLIYVNRSWSQSTWSRRDIRNPTFPFIAAAALTLLALVLGIPLLRSVFVFALPPATLAWIGIGASLLSLLWFEAVKRYARTSHVRSERRRPPA
jgi:Ca2+-transporting ATPase